MKKIHQFKGIISKNEKIIRKFKENLVLNKLNKLVKLLNNLELFHLIILI